MSSITAIPGVSVPTPIPVESLPREDSQAQETDSIRPSATDETTTAGETVPDPAAAREEISAVMAEFAKALATASDEPRAVDLYFDEERDTYVVEVRNESDGELIRQFPPEKILKMRDRLDELVGTVIDRLS